MIQSKNKVPDSILAKWKTSLLHLSIQYNFQNLTNYLITHGSNLDSQDNFGKTPLLKATYQLQSKTVQFLLNENADMMLSDSNGKNALQTALEFPSISECRPIIKSFIEKIANICSNDNDVIARLLSKLKCPLGQIIYFRDANLTRTMLSRGCKVNQRNPSDGNTALHIAVMLVDLENVKLLLDFGADRNAMNHEGYMPFFSIFNGKRFKIENTSLEIIKLVMPLNVDWTKCDKNGRLMLYSIFVNSSVDFLRIFLDTYLINLNARDTNGKTPLHYLVEHDKTEEYEIFKSTSIDVNVRDNQGRTPLHIAAMRGNADAVKFLLDKGADVNAIYAGQIPVYLVFGRESIIDQQRCIALLLQNATREQLTMNSTTIYMRIFKRYDEDEQALTFSKSVTAHLAMLEKAKRPSLKFDPSVPFYTSSLFQTLEPYYRRLWRERMATVTFYHWAYKEQLDGMMKVMVYGSTSLFDILTDDNCGRLISRYAWKVERVKELRDKFYKEKYAFYYKLRLTTRFDNAEMLACWRYQLSEILSDCTGLFDFDHVVIEKIVRLLEYDDLKSFNIT